MPSAARAPAIVLAAMLITGCQVAASPPPTPGDASPSPAAATALPFTQARRELDDLLERLETTHPNPFHGIERAAWVGELERLKGDLETLTPFGAQVELQRLVALLSREGRDGHQFALPLDEAEAPTLPIRVYEFEEGVFITAATPPLADLAGLRLAAIDGRPIDEILAAVEPLVPRDGPATVSAFRPMFLTRTSVLRGLGLIGDGQVDLLVAGTSGGLRQVTVDPVAFEPGADWIGGFGAAALPGRADTRYLSEPGPDLWWQVIEATDTLYIRYERVTRIDAVELDGIREAAASESLQRVVLDLRQNPGGDNTTLPPLLRTLRDPAIDREGRFFVLTDRRTFSAASNLATQLEQSTSAGFAGEPMGGGLNFWNDVAWVQLRHFPVPMQVGVSTRYWQFAAPDDPRLTIEPDVRVPVRAADYFAGRDPVLEAIGAE